MERLNPNTERLVGPPTGGKRRGETTPLGSVLQAMVRRWGKVHELTMLTLRQRWPEIAGPLFAETAVPVRIDDEKRLVLAVRGDGAAAMELRGRGARYRELLESCREASDCHITELVIETRQARASRTAAPG